MIWHSPGGFTYFRSEVTFDPHDYFEFDGVTYEVMDEIFDKLDPEIPTWYRVVMV